MNVWISAQETSDALWRRLVRDQQGMIMDVPFEYVERSIPPANVAALTVLAHAAKPQIVAEIGTGIGRSTRILAKIAQQVWTCDTENHGADLNDVPGVLPHTGATSTTMLKRIKESGQKPDFYFIDGRIQQDDFALISELRTEHTVFALDDTEGFEKGVVNANILSNIVPNYFFLPPPTFEPFVPFGVVGRHTIGLMVPNTSLAFTRQ